MKKNLTTLRSDILKYLKIAAIPSLLFLLLQSCYKKDDFNFNRLAQMDYNPEVAVPLVHSYMTLHNVLDDYDHHHVFVEDGTHFLYLIYERSIYSPTAEQLISIADQNVNTNYIFSVTTPIPAGDSASASQTFTHTLTMVNPDESFDTVYIKAGTLDYNFSSNNLNHNAKITVTIPSATKFGIPFKQEIPYTYSGTLPVAFTNSFNLTGYKVGFSHAGGLTQLQINYTVTVYGDGTAVTPPFSISMGESFSNIKYSRLIGYLGLKTITLSDDTVKIEIFNNNIQGYYNFEDPKLHINIGNSFGIPVDVLVNLIRARSVYNLPHVVDVTGSGIPNPWVINYPSFAQIGQSMLTSLTLDKNNSTIKDAINISPQNIYSNISATCNPAGPPNTNFVLDTSRIKVNAQLELPLYGKAWDFILQDTAEFTYMDVNEADWVELKLILDNGFPIDGLVQLYFTDSNYVVKDSLLNPFQQVMMSAIPGGPPDYKVVQNTKKTTLIRWEGSRWRNLKDCKKILVRAELNTANSGTTIVKLYSSYGLDVRLGVRAQGHMMVGFN